MKSFTPCIDVLSPEQKEIFPYLHEVSQLGFVLYGGTAVALRLGHRESVDFDFFSDRPLDTNTLYDSVSFLEDSVILDAQPQHRNNSLNVLIGKSRDTKPVKMSFFGGIDLGRIGDPEFTTDGNLLVASLQDLMAFKLRIVLERTEAKDYQDIAAMIRAGESLAHGLAGAKALYGNQYQPAISLRALTFFDDGSLKYLSSEDKSTLIHAAASVRELPKMTLRSKNLGADESEVPYGDMKLVLRKPKPT